MNLYIPTIHVLRAIAALLVCLYHFTNSTYGAGTTLPEGDTLREIGKLGADGVYIFFVITGCVIPLSMLNGNYTMKRIHRFIARRWLRVELPYVASILAFICIYYLNCRIFMWNFEFDPMRFVHHIFYTLPFTDYEWYNPVYWTLAIELQFYLVIALLFPLISHPNKWISISTIVLFGCSSLVLHPDYLLFHYAAVFSLGILVFLLLTKRIGRVEGWLVILALVGMVVWINGLQTALFSSATCLLIAFVTIEKKRFNTLGNISYSVYLIHGITGGTFLNLALYAVHDYWARLALIPVALLVSIACSWIFWRLFEKPSQTLSKRVQI